MLVIRPAHLTMPNGRVNVGGKTRDLSAEPRASKRSAMPGYRAGVAVVLTSIADV